MNSTLNNLFHLVIVAPLLWSLGSNKFPEQYKIYLVYFAILMVIYYLYKISVSTGLWKRVKVLTSMEGFNQEFDCSLDNVHCIDMFDSNPGYSRPIIQVKKGDIVVWKNIGETQHTVTSTDCDTGMNPDLTFSSEYLKPGQKFAVQFTSTGEFPYYSILNKGWMRGKVIVQ